MQKNSINKVILIGHVGNDPEVKYTPSGSSIACLSLATNEVWINADKEKKERVEWHSLIAWNKLADFATEYLQKGQLIYLEGRLQTRNYKDKDNIQRRITEVISTSITPLEWKTSIKKNSMDTADNGKEQNEAEGDKDGFPF